MNTSITKLSNDFFRTFTDKTLLFLLEHGWDTKYGGLLETLDSQGKNGPEDFRRVMLHARQLFVFSRWTRVTGDKTFERMADKIFEYLTASFWDADYGGWYSRVALDGKALDFTKDLYAHAFVLFGLLHYAEYIKKNEAEAWIEKTKSCRACTITRRKSSGPFFPWLSKVSNKPPYFISQPCSTKN